VLARNAVVTELGEKASRRISPPGIRPLAGCRAVIGGKRNGYGVQRPGEEVIANGAVGLITHDLL
jgi:hypothetical protein